MKYLGEWQIDNLFPAQETTSTVAQINPDRTRYELQSNLTFDHDIPDVTACTVSMCDTERSIEHLELMGESTFFFHTTKKNNVKKN